MQRRELIKRLAATSVAGATGVSNIAQQLANAADKKRKKLPIAAVVTTYHNNSHADVIVGKVLEGYKQDGGDGPDLKIASLFTDQVPSNDMSRAMAKKHDVPIVKTIDEALTLGTNSLQVSGVLCIGEHGNYPSDPKTGQKMFPRRRFFDEVVATFKRCDQVVPVFNDKHLSYRWADAIHMYRTAKQMKIPYMAGSSLPVTWREPELVLPLECEIESAISIGYGGLESYGFHALETLQCMIERRRGGEAGLKSVQTVSGKNIWKAEKDGRWSRELLEAALETLPYKGKGDRRAVLEKSAKFFLLEHRDGLRSSVAMANGLARDFGFAVKLRDKKEPLAAWFRLQDAKPYGHFAFLVKAFEKMVRTGKPPYPVERTLLTTGALDAAMHSFVSEGKRVDTPEMNIAYRLAS